MENQNLSNSNSLNKNKSQRVRPRLSRTLKYYRQQDQLKQILIELESLREYQTFEGTQRADLEEALQALQVRCLRQDKELLELKLQLQQLRTLPNQLDQALEWVGCGLRSAREHLQQQQQQLLETSQQEEHV